MDALTTFLLRAIDYDLWANRKWLSALENLPDPTHARNVMFHMADAHHCWLTRIGAIAEGTPLPDDDLLDQNLQNYADLWKSALAAVPVDHVYHWTDNGDPYHLPLADIVFHIVNHGTYHRGHLRGLADAAKVESFEDTDYDWFAS